MNFFEVEDLSQQLTIEDLLTAAAISNEEVESWQFGDECDSGLGGTNPELIHEPSDGVPSSNAVPLSV